MSKKKSLLALAAAALASMAFASAAMAAEDGHLLHVETEAEPENRATHFVGWAQFTDALGRGLKCHVTAVVEFNNGTTGHVTNFSIPDTEKCESVNPTETCTLVEDAITLPEGGLHVTVTPTDFDITGELVIHQKLGGANCHFQGETTLTFNEITAKPLETGEREVTGTAGNLGGTAEPGTPIAGVEIEGVGTIDPSKGVVTAAGELELTEADRCTWKLG